MSARPLKLLAIAAAFAVPAATTSVALGALREHDHDTHSRHHAQDEPEDAKPASPPRQFASGTTPSGQPWSAVQYPNKRGSVCIDVALGRGVGGGCFTRGLQTPQWGRTWDAASNDSVVSGLHTPGRGVSVRFAGGGVVRGRADADGLFVVAGRGDGATVTFE